MQAHATIVAEARDRIDLYENDVARQQCLLRLSPVELGHLNMLIESVLETNRDTLLESCKTVAAWLTSFSMPPTSTIAEKQEHLAILEAAIAKAEGREP